MTTGVIGLVLLAALAHASWNAMLKGKRGEPLAASAGLCVAWFVFGAPLTIFVDAPAVAAWPYLGASIAVHLAYFGLLVAAYRVADLSLVYPIARGTPPLLVAVVGWFVVGEQPSALGVAGVALVACAVLGLGLAAAPRRRAAPPPPSPDVASGTRANATSKGVGLAFATAIFIAGYTVIDGLGVRESGAPLGYAVWLSTLQGGIFAAAVLLFGGPAIRREVWQRRKEGALAGVLSAGGYAVALWAMSLAPIAYVSALRETSVVFAAAIGALFLKESFGRARIVAAIVVAAGVIAIQIAG